MAKRILVIEDEKDLMETLALRLESNNYEVLKAYNYFYRARAGI